MVNTAVSFKIALKYFNNKYKLGANVLLFLKSTDNCTQNNIYQTQLKLVATEKHYSVYSVVEQRNDIKLAIL